jgi:integrase/recombinase XerD
MAAAARSLTLADAVAEFLGALGSERGLAANTVAAYRRDLRPYVERLAEKGRRDVGSVTAQDVSAYVRDLHRSDLAPASIARKVSAVRGLHRFLVMEELAAADPTSTLEAPRRAVTLPKALTVEEVISLLDVPDRSTPLGSRDAALLEFLYASGARVSEAGKGNRQRVVPLGRPAVAAISAYLPIRMDLRGGRPDPERLFLNSRGSPLSRPAVWQLVRQHARSAGLEPERVSPHVLRHSAATHMVEGGADLRTVQEMLGHASISTTQIYTRVSPQHLLEVYVSTHPRSR